MLPRTHTHTHKLNHHHDNHLPHTHTYLERLEQQRAVAPQHAPHVMRVRVPQGPRRQRGAPLPTSRSQLRLFL